MPVPLLTVYRGQELILRPKERLGHVSHLRADFAPQGHVFVDKLPHLLSTNEEGFKHFSVAWRQGIRRTDSAWIMLLCACGSLNLSRASYVGSFPCRRHQLESSYLGGGVYAFRAQFRSDENSPVDCSPKRGLFEHEMHGPHPLQQRRQPESHAANPLSPPFPSQKTNPFPFPTNHDLGKRKWRTQPGHAT